jgi:hypothetical protein
VSWLVASSERTDLAALRDAAPALWREVRRFNAPVQLAIAAAHDVAAFARSPADAAIISLAPCRSGSPELLRWVRDIDAGRAVRMNPTHTLHAVDNLALSVVSIAFGNHAWGMSLGGAAGMLWAALELVRERLVEQHEVIVIAGDQDLNDQPGPAAGVALLFAREAAPYAPRGRPAELVAIERRRKPAPCTPHAAAGALELLAALRASPAGRFVHVVSPAHGDGLDEIAAVWELG